jgi:hypothetical protein
VPTIVVGVGSSSVSVGIAVIDVGTMALRQVSLTFHNALHRIEVVIVPEFCCAIVTLYCKRLHHLVSWKQIVQIPLY